MATTSSYFSCGWEFARLNPEVENVIQAMKYTTGLVSVTACDSWSDGFIAQRKVLKDHAEGTVKSIPSLKSRKK